MVVNRGRVGGAVASSAPAGVTPSRRTEGGGPRHMSTASRHPALRTRWLVAIALAVLLIVGFIVAMTRGFSYRDRVSVTEAFLTADDHLTLLVGTCGGEPELDLLKELDESVQVAVVSTRTVGGSGGDCLDTVDVRLVQPLGDRALIDAATGGAIDLVTR